ncbi:MAG TPA: hypothetical protein VF178_10315, partial [Gemmatimonadaceae bacterium]
MSAANGAGTVTSREWRIDVGGDSISARLEATSPDTGRTVFVCAHGAGGHYRDRGMDRLAATLVPRGVDMVRFNF